MKAIRVSVWIFVVLLGVGGVFTLAEPATVVGYVMPVACKDRKAGGIVAHTTVCALEPDCIETGFGLWTEEAFTKFDTQGNELALKYFRSTHREDNHKVRVIGNLARIMQEIRIRVDWGSEKMP